MTHARAHGEAPETTNDFGDRGDRSGGVRRDCLHPRARHRHGTRAAYVADRCRCPECRDANRVEAAARRRAALYGRWQPYVDAEPVREHVARLRAAGIGINRIIALSGVASGTVRQLVYGGRGPRRVRARTAAAILAVTTGRPARGALVAAAGTHALLADLEQAGHALPDLAHALGRTPASLTATLTRRQVTAATAYAVQHLHHRLLGQHGQHRPPGLTSEEAGPDSGVTETIQDVSGDLIDEVAIERAITGGRVTLTPTELSEAIRRLTHAGTSDRRTALLLGISARTVARRRATAAA